MEQKTKGMSLTTRNQKIGLIFIAICIAVYATIFVDGDVSPEAVGYRIGGTVMPILLLFLIEFVALEIKTLKRTLVIILSFMFGSGTIGFLSEIFPIKGDSFLLLYFVLVAGPIVYVFNHLKKNAEQQQAGQVNSDHKLP